MSEENVEIVRRGLDAFALGDVETSVVRIDMFATRAKAPAAGLGG